MCQVVGNTNWNQKISNASRAIVKILKVFYHRLFDRTKNVKSLNVMASLPQ